jgi:hypothetical protein
MALDSDTIREDVSPATVLLSMPLLRLIGEN